MGDAPLEPLDYKQKGRGSVRPKRRYVLLLILLALSFSTGAIGWLLMPHRIGSRDINPREKCASNLRQIGLAIQMYANDNKGQLPPDLGAVLATQDLTSNDFVCPSSSDDRATGPTTQAILQDFAKPGRCSYVLASPLPSMWNLLTPAHVLAYEPPANHNGDGMNVLFGDCHAEFVEKSQAGYILAELKAGYNPPRTAK
jgi:prepilin-type processing-associated H-X9-DG protein